ncbi:MAG: VanZ family protein [bacterium]
MITAIAVAFLTLLPHYQIGFIIEPYDYLKHFSAYFILGILMWIPCRDKFKDKSSFEIAISILVILIVYGTVLEIGQYLSPGRTPKFLDAVSNVFGAVASQVLMVCMPKKTY